MARIRRNLPDVSRCAWLVIVLAALLPSASQAQTGVSSPGSPTGYHVVGRFPIGGEGGWDYISIDSDARRLYVSHGTQIEVPAANSVSYFGKIFIMVVNTPGG